MGKLIIFNLILIAIIALGLWLVKKYVKKERAQNIILIVAAIFTIVFHYSSFIFKLLSGSNAIEYLGETPNLILPIYPCNVVMWSALIFALLKNKKSRIGSFFVDYLFWFGIISTLVGMFANVDFIMNPTLADYENFKSITAHATLLFNILLLSIFGYIKIDVKRNIINIIISVFVMAIIGGDGLDFLTYPVISLIAVPIYFVVFVIFDLCVHKKGERFYNKLGNNVGERNV